MIHFQLCRFSGAGFGSEQNSVSVAVSTGTEVPLGERCVGEGGVSRRRLWTTRDSHQRGRHAGVPALSLPD